MKFGQLIEYNSKDIFLNESFKKYGEFPEHLLKIKIYISRSIV